MKELKFCDDHEWVGNQDEECPECKEISDMEDRKNEQNS